MANIIQRRRGSTLQHSTFTGSEGEITVDLTKDTVVVHDGSTVAGFPLARENMSNVSNSVGVQQLNLSEGTTGQVISTDGAGTLSFTTVDVTGSSVGGDLSGTVGNAQIVANAVGTTEIADANVTGVKIASGTIQQSNLDANSVGTSQLQALSVTNSELGDLSISNAKLQTDAVITSKILDSNVTTSKIADANVTDVKLATDSVVTAKILNANVTDEKILSLSASKLTGALPAISGAALTGLSAGVATGIIAMWSGAIAAIPSGWVICDGTNSTPDLRDRFVIGAGTTYAVDATGGSTSTAGATLSIAQLAAHTHQYNATNTTSEGGDNAAQSAIHASTATSSTGSGATHTHTGTLPPYYALAYIMKS